MKTPSRKKTEKEKERYETEEDYAPWPSADNHDAEYYPWDFL
jgi:hypothetical protein